MRLSVPGSVWACSVSDTNHPHYVGVQLCYVRLLPRPVIGCQPMNNMGWAALLRLRAGREHLQSPLRQSLHGRSHSRLYPLSDWLVRTTAAPAAQACKALAVRGPAVLEAELWAGAVQCHTKHWKRLPSGQDGPAYVGGQQTKEPLGCWAVASGVDGGLG